MHWQSRADFLLIVNQKPMLYKLNSDNRQAEYIQHCLEVAETKFMVS